MGMQCHFSRDDCDGANISRGASVESNSWYIDGFGRRVLAYSDNGQDFWFDIGSCSEQAMANLKSLIAMRILFRCS